MFVLALLAGQSPPLFAVEKNAEPSARSVLDRFMAEVHHYQARFEQTLYDEYGEELESSVGKVTLVKPGKFRWEYEQPYRQLIVSNGELMWVYDEDLEQVTVNKIPPQSSQSPLALLINGAAIDESYLIEEGVDEGIQEGDLKWLKLTPQFAESEYQRVDIGVNNADVMAMRLYDNLNQVTALQFFDANKRAKIDEQSFEFLIPPGVDVVNGVD